MLSTCTLASDICCGNCTESWSFKWCLSNLNQKPIGLIWKKKRILSFSILFHSKFRKALCFEVVATKEHSNIKMFLVKKYQLNSIHFGFYEIVNLSWNYWKVDAIWIFCLKLFYAVQWNDHHLRLSCNKTTLIVAFLRIQYFRIYWPKKWSFWKRLKIKTTLKSPPVLRPTLP